MVHVMTELEEWKKKYNDLWEQYVRKREKLDKKCWKALEEGLKKAGFTWNEELKVWERPSKRGIISVEWGVNYIHVLSSNLEEGELFAKILSDGTITLTAVGSGGSVYLEHGVVECTDVMSALNETLGLFGELEG